MKKIIKISELNIVQVTPQNGLIAFVSFLLDEKFYMGCIAVFQRPDGGIRLVFPQKNNMPCFYPVRKEIGAYIEKIVQENINNNFITNNNYGRYNSRGNTSTGGS